MEKIIYINLLGEGVPVYRPVPAVLIRPNVYLVGGHDIYDSEDEEWEFSPGAAVIVEEKLLSGELTLVAVASA
jgi:hypothetical protein